jgi:hypothetical protein
MKTNWWTPARLSLYGWVLCPFTQTEWARMNLELDRMPGFKEMNLGANYEFMALPNDAICARRTR